ncbi:MAG: sulfatase [Planctomycetota bacterium]
MKYILIVIGLLGVASWHACCSAEPAEPVRRPNVVWIVADDLGLELSCYGYPDLATPHMDRLANAGRRFTHAFATSPVCSASRTAFQTGRYQTAIGGHHHLTRDPQVLPPDVPTVTELLRDAGYFVCNGDGTPSSKPGKMHFNFVADRSTYFDGTDWSQRATGQPFFAQVQIKQPHRPFEKAIRIRDDAPIPPVYPEHAITRADWSNYLASIELLDQKVGRVLDRLESERLISNTLVILFGDHGRPHVWDKQWLTDGGLQIPLIIQFPGTQSAGVIDDRLVSLLDLMPTTLIAVGLADEYQSLIERLPGGNLLDLDWLGHDVLFAARDRCGDAPDRIRSVRSRGFRLTRNLEPHRPYTQHSGYKKLQYPVLTLMRVLHQRGQWDSPWMATERPIEELYDLRDDPHQLRNIAGDPEYHDTRRSLAAQLDRWMEQCDIAGQKDESMSVDIPKLLAEKRQWYERAMKRRGLSPDITDEAYLNWWYRELGVE